MIKITITIFSIIQFSLATINTFAQATLDNQALKTKIDDYLTEGVENGFSGAVLVAKQGEIIIKRGYGLANKVNDIAYTPTTVSTIGSVTKQFTATAILKLQDLGKLKVTDPISNFFDKLPNDKRDITIHQLLTHSAGLVDVIGRGDFDDIPTKRFFKTLFEIPLLHQPGTKYAYSNTGYSILAKIIEITSGQKYEHFLNEHLFTPAGMHQTGYFLPKWDEALVANGYLHNVTNIGSMISRYQKMGKVTWTLKGNGGIHSTLEDMFKWYEALKNNKILPRSQFEKLTTPAILENEGGTSHYAYGWAIQDSKNGTKIINHNGGNAVFFHDFIWMPEEDIVIILFTNAASREVEVAWPIAHVMLDGSFEPAPIKKNLHQFVLDFIQTNELSQSDLLVSMIRKKYRTYIRNSNNLNELGYKALEVSKNAGWAVELFKLNVELFPSEGNLRDSLGDGYLANGQTDEAKRSFEKALELAPEKDCFWCKSSAKSLSSLR